ncbi:MAG: hypothetical protein Q8S73_25285 [Deltaproteobacteria bacterium]|nr:hypothetical protein [Myxococcales bacterium]MDP3217450.1 hypothetical protein [Deltaproteobacteria bacterium]
MPPRALGSAGAGRVLSGGVVALVYDQVIRDFSPERREQIERVFAEVRRDPTLLVQLTPEGKDLFNALATERDGVRRGGAGAPTGACRAWRATTRWCRRAHQGGVRGASARGRVGGSPIGCTIVVDERLDGDTISAPDAPHATALRRGGARGAAPR